MTSYAEFKKVGQDLNQGSGGGFIPFAQFPFNQTSHIAILSDWSTDDPDSDDKDDIPPIQIYDRYHVDGLYEYGKRKNPYGVDFSWDYGDEYHPLYIEQQQKAQEEAEKKGDNFTPYKMQKRAFAYIFNISGWMAFNNYKKNNPVHEAYHNSVKQGSGKKKFTKEMFDGPLILDMNTFMVQAVYNAMDDQENFHPDIMPSARDYVYSINIEKEEGKTTWPKYSVSADFTKPLREELIVDEDDISNGHRKMMAMIGDLIEDFKGELYSNRARIESMRYKGESPLFNPEEFEDEDDDFDEKFKAAQKSKEKPKEKEEEAERDFDF